MPDQAPQRTRRHLAVIETVLGLALTATPVALWIAWEPEILFGVLVAALASALLLDLVHRLDAAGRAAPSWERPELQDQFFVEMHRLFPLIHHHSGRESARFRSVMRRLRRRLP